MPATPDRQSRFVGCLLGGAIGDALGYPIEFYDEERIERYYGVNGIRNLPNPALISDDTQMTLFTAAGQLYGLAQHRPANAADIFLAYREWLGTQGDTSRMDDPAKPKLSIYRRKELHALRAPGNTCLEAIRTSLHGGTPEFPVNHSKGCGGIMRVAPIGLAGAAGADAAYAVRLAAEAAALTHGHQMGFLSAALFAAMIQEIIQPKSANLPFPQVLQTAIDTFHGQFTQFKETAKLCRFTETAIAMAQNESIDSLDGIHYLGEGWVGEEALYIAVFAAVRHEYNFAAAIRCAVNHKGDSDSTGAIAGNLLGARLGVEAVIAAFPIDHLELADLIRDLALELEQASRPAPTKTVPEYTIGSVVFGDWTITEELGAGAFGSVYRLEKEGYGFKTTSALKVIRVPQSPSEYRSIRDESMDDRSTTSYFRGIVDDILKEIAVLHQLKGHPGIVSYEDHRIVEHTESVGWDIQIRMELLTPLSDYQRSNTMSHQDILNLALQLTEALDYCQKKNLIHRDIKPENIFVSDSGRFKLGDFGIARTVEQSGGMSKKGTEIYMAPEVYLGKPYNGSVDLYSLGLVLYRLCNNNRLPFFPSFPQPVTYKDRETALHRRMKGQCLPRPANATPHLWQIIRKACAYRPEDRYQTAAEMLQDLRNPSPERQTQPVERPREITREQPSAFPDGPEGYVREEPVAWQGAVPVYLYRHHLPAEIAERLRQTVPVGVGKAEIWVTHRFPLMQLPLTVTVEGGAVLRFSGQDSKHLLSKLIPSGGHIVVRCVFPALPGYVEEITVHLTESKAKQLQYGQLDGVTNLVYVHNTNGKSCCLFNEIEKFSPVSGVFTSFAAGNCFYPIRSELFRPRILWITSAIANQAVRLPVQIPRKGFLNIPALVKTGEPNVPLATTCLLVPVKVNGRMDLVPVGICYQIKLEVPSSTCAIWDRSADLVYWADTVPNAQNGRYFVSPAKQPQLETPAASMSMANPFLRFLSPK